MGEAGNWDTSVLAAEAGNFDRIAGSLKGVMAQVDATAGAMHGHLRGVAGIAAQAAFVRYQEAAQVQQTALNEIAANIHGGGVTYDSQDHEHGASLGQTINVPQIM
jgi:WXG100 family type VII secretion target